MTFRVLLLTFCFVPLKNVHAKGRTDCCILHVCILSPRAKCEKLGNSSNTVKVIPEIQKKVTNHGKVSCSFVQCSRMIWQRLINAVAQNIELICIDTKQGQEEYIRQSNVPMLIEPIGGKCRRIFQWGSLITLLKLLDLLRYYSRSAKASLINYTPPSSLKENVVEVVA